MVRLTDKLNLLADARFAQVMERRRREGKETVNGCSCLAVMFALVNRSDQDGCCHPSFELIAEESQAGPRTAKRVIAVMVEEGVITIESRSRTNNYRIDWASLQECGDGGRKTCANLTQADPDNCSYSEQCQSDTRSSAELAQDVVPICPTRSASPAPDLCQSVRALKEGTSQEPPNEPPPTPKAAAGRGEVASASQEAGSDREHAIAIVDAYPPTSSDSRDADELAALAAIERERTLADGIRWDEIRAAAHSVRAVKLRDPRWCRKWLAERGYLKLVMAARQRSARKPAASAGLDFRTAIQVERQEHERAQSRVDALLAGKSREELEALRSEALEGAGLTAISMLGRADPMTSAPLRGYIADLIERKALRGAA